jgi:zinc/manganese transport system substrate-binding protein
MGRWRRLVASVCAGAASWATVSGCAGGAAGDTPGTIDVVASTDVWGSVAAAVGGSRVSVSSIIDDSGQDPHSFEGSSRTLLAVRDADLLLENGGGYDDFMTRLISASGSRAPVVDAVETSGLVAGADGELNEHVWYDIPSAVKVAHAVAARLAALAPRHAAEFKANARAFDRDIRGLLRHEHQVAAASAGTGVAVTEPVPLYMLSAMGLRNLTPADFSRAVEDSSDLSPRVLSETLALFSEHRVALLAYNAQTSGPVTEQVEGAARTAGIPVVPVTETLPDGMSYLSWMAHNVDAIAEAVTSHG